MYIIIPKVKKITLAIYKKLVRVNALYLQENCFTEIVEPNEFYLLFIETKIMSTNSPIGSRFDNT